MIYLNSRTLVCKKDPLEFCSAEKGCESVNKDFALTPNPRALLLEVNCPESIPAAFLTRLEKA